MTRMVMIFLGEIRLGLHVEVYTRVQGPLETDQLTMLRWGRGDARLTRERDCPRWVL